MEDNANLQTTNGTTVHKRQKKTDALNGDTASEKSDENLQPGNQNVARYLSVDEVSPQFKEIFIVSGYRRPYSSAKECFLSIFQIQSNECLNVWTHLLPLFCFIIRFAHVFSSLSFSDPYNYPLMCFALSICGFCSMSCGAHMFNSMSPRLRHTCFFFDYAAIAIYCFGASQVFFYYGRPAYSDIPIYNNHLLFLGISAFVSLSANFLCCASRHRWLSVKYLIRTMPFVVAFLFIISPVVWRTYTCIEATDCNFESLSYHKRHATFYLFAALINVSRLPERLTPGTFDCIGNSHHFLHLFTAIGSSDEFSAIFSDMTNRREILDARAGPTFLNSVGLMAAFAVVNIAIVLYFAKQLKSDKEEGDRA
jgi:predicted membrane channel-forming protein YqfA (hemolysin III family)